jgi:hypothetical protein
MKPGTKTVLYGTHQFALHPFFVAAAWTKLYGFPKDVRLWAAFFVHDIGYWGKSNLDGPEGEEHPQLGANIMGRLFGPEWAEFTKYHSRFLARRDSKQFSRLCVADKLAITLYPWWFYIPLAILSGEIYEYQGHVRTGKYRNHGVDASSHRAWLKTTQDAMRKWAMEHVNGGPDTFGGYTE